MIKKGILKSCLLCIYSIFVLVTITGCVGTHHKGSPNYAPAVPIQYPESNPADQKGSIFQPGVSAGLFEDFRARQVGDILTVILNESTEAEKSSDTSIDKSDSTIIDNPILAGATRVIGGDQLAINFDLENESAFEGESESNQSNSLQGEVAVTVAKVLPNGNLYIQGEKWIKLNQGNEFIRLKGIVRPADITAANTIDSTRIADARIAYSGTGAVAEVNVRGWLSRFFSSPLFPF